MAPRRGLRAPAFLLVLTVVATLLAGCHGEDPAPTPPAAARDRPNPASPAPSPPPPPGPDPLPRLGLSAETIGATATLIVTLDGDVDAILVHTLDFGDGSEALTLPGPPASRYTYTYPTPDDYRSAPGTHTASLSLHSAAGHVRSATTTITVEPPPNQAPLPRLGVDHVRGEIPLRVLFTIDGTDHDGQVRSWTLDPGDGSPDTRGAKRPTRQIAHEYRNVGTFTATLTLEDDSGKQGVHAVRIDVWPPQNARTWTLDDAQDLLIQHDGNGTVLSTEALRRPRCGTGTTCEDAVGLTAVGRQLHLAVARPLANGTVWTYDGLTGKALRETDVAHHPEAIWGARDAAWVTHKTSGIVARIVPGESKAQFITTPLGNQSSKLLVADADGSTVWATAREHPARLVQIDTTTRQALTVPIPLTGRPTHLAYSATHHTVVVVGDTGDVVLFDPMLYGPVPRAVHPSHAPEGSPPFALACPDASPTCWIAYGPTETQDGRLVGIPVDAPAAALADEAIIVPIPAARVPVSVHATDGRVIVGIGTQYSPERGYLVLDAATATITHESIEHRAGGGPRIATAHPGFPSLLYLDDPARGGWQILDVTTGTVVHRSVATHAAADAILVISGR